MSFSFDIIVNYNHTYNCNKYMLIANNNYYYLIKVKIFINQHKFNKN
jgi:hypothetical protein